MSLDHLDLRDPQRLLEELAPTVDYTAPGAWVVLVHRPDTSQRVLATHRLPDLVDREAEAEHDASRARSDHLAQWLRSPPIPPRLPRRLTTVAVTVVVRPGRNITGWQEWAWIRAWRYSNHLTDAIDTDILTVTEHGWSSMLLHEGGADPRLRLAVNTCSGPQ